MALNKAMADLYKQRAAVRDAKTTPSKRSVTKLEPEQPPIIEASKPRKRPRIDEIIASFNESPVATFDKIYGCDEVIKDLKEILDDFKACSERDAETSCWPVLIHGSHGLGKTSLVEAASNYSNLPLVRIPLRSLVKKTRNEFEVIIEQYIRLEVTQQPSIILVDDLDLLNDKEDNIHIVRDLIYRVLKNKTIVFCTSSTVLPDPPHIDFLTTIYLKRPTEESRYAILRDLRDRLDLRSLSDDDLTLISTKTPSFTAMDLKKMLIMSRAKSSGCPNVEPHCTAAIDVIKKSFRSGSYLIEEKPSVRWEDIGGLPEVRKAFNDILRQMRRDNMSCKFSGVALYGPPGCGKTMVAQAMANEAGMNFISIKPAELVDKFLGETEKNIRKVFRDAKEYEPCMIYFDEFDGLCGSRGTKYNITSAIQTLLSEIDGFESRGKSMIMVSTNRLNDIDPAMKRPGRLSEHIYIGPPNKDARREIINVNVKKLQLSLDSSVDLNLWADKTKGFTGAHLAFLIEKAKSIAANDLEHLDNISISNRMIEQAWIKICSSNKKLRGNLTEFRGVN